MGLRRLIFALFLAPTLHLTATDGARAVDLAIVVEQGDPAPGLAAGTVFGAPGEPVIGAAGDIAFTVQLLGGDTTTDTNESVWTGKPGALRLLAREGDPAPGTEAGTVFDAFFPENALVVTRGGQVVFRARLRGPDVTGANSLGYWMGTPGDLKLLVRLGDEAPDLPGVIIEDIPRGAIPCTDAGCVFMLGRLSDALLAPGVWTGLPGALHLALRTGDAAPGIVPATTIGNLRSASFAINELGVIAIPARLATNVDVVYTGKPGMLEPFLIGGDVFPDLNAGEFLFAPDIVNINNAGQLTFASNIGIPRPAQTLQEESVWTGTKGDLRLIARKGEAVADAPGFAFNSFVREPVINGAGVTLFESVLRTPASSFRNFALFRGAADTPTEMLASLDAGVPGVPGVPVNGFHARSINAAGNVAFFTGGAFVDALWFDVSGAVELIATSGTVFDAGAKGMRTITNFIPTVVSGESGSEDGKRSFFSDDGQVVFSAVLDKFFTAILITQAPPPNSPPVVDAFDLAPADEGDVVGLSVAFTDDDAGDTHTATVDWGDGSPADTIDPAASPIAASHVYADNGTFTVSVTVTDAAGDSSAASAPITIGNLAPSVAAGADQSATVGDTVDLDPATFHDPGTADTHLATVNWGDSTIDIVGVSEAPFGPPGSAAGLDGTVAASHAYAAPGSFTVTVTVTDDDAGVGQDTFTVDVASPPPPPLQCDLDGDGDIDRADIRIILAARNQPATGPDDPRDIDGDGRITVLDARKCALRLTTR